MIRCEAEESNAKVPNTKRVVVCGVTKGRGRQITSPLERSERRRARRYRDKTTQWRSGLAVAKQQSFNGQGGQE